MSGTTGNEACNSTSPLLSEGGFSFGPDVTMGIWKYPDLAGSPVANGSQRGGFGSTITNGAWWFKYAGAAPFSFFFRVMADNNAPVLTVAPTLVQGQALSFFNVAANGGPTSARIELCNLNPGPPVNGSTNVPCPAGATVNVVEAPVTGTFVPASGRNVFSVVPTTALSAGTYWWRARNIYAAGPATIPSGWVQFAFTALPTVQTPASFLANDGAALLEWTTEPATVDTYFYLCDTTCAGAAPVILAEGPVAADALPDPRWPTLSYYQAPPAFLLNPATRDPATPAGIYWLAPATYETRVFNYDGVNVPAITGLHGSGTTSITPVGIVPTNLLPAAGPASVALTTFTWATDPIITSTTIDFIDVVDPQDRLQDVLIGTNVVTNPPGYSLAASATNLSTYVIGPTTVEVQLFNTDLYGSVSAVIRQYTMTP
jgi:hypothetical protein